jgi:branched-chain amino acid transport system permease protein
MHRGIAGIVITPIALMDYERGTELAIKGFAAAVIGGMGSVEELY